MARDNRQFPNQTSWDFCASPCEWLFYKGFKIVQLNPGSRSAKFHLSTSVMPQLRTNGILCYTSGFFRELQLHQPVSVYTLARWLRVLVKPRLRAGCQESQLCIGEWGLSLTPPRLPPRIGEWLKGELITKVKIFHLLLIPALARQRKACPSEFKTSLDYLASLKAVRATQWDPVIKEKQKQSFDPASQTAPQKKRFPGKHDDLRWSLESTVEGANWVLKAAPPTSSCMLWHTCMCVYIHVNTQTWERQ